MDLIDIDACDVVLDKTERKVLVKTSYGQNHQFKATPSDLASKWMSKILEAKAAGCKAVKSKPRWACVLFIIKLQHIQTVNSSKSPKIECFHSRVLPVLFSRPITMINDTDVSDRPDALAASQMRKHGRAAGGDSSGSASRGPPGSSPDAGDNKSLLQAFVAAHCPDDSEAAADFESEQSALMHILEEVMDPDQVGVIFEQIPLFGKSHCLANPKG